MKNNWFKIIIAMGVLATAYSLYLWSQNDRYYMFTDPVKILDTRTGVFYTNNGAQNWIK